MTHGDIKSSAYWAIAWIYDIGPNPTDNIIVLNLIGTDYNILVRHIDQDDIVNFEIGQVFKPGDLICPFPTEEGISFISWHNKKSTKRYRVL